MSDIVPPCDCIELIDGQFTYRCECSNRGDGERAAAWCVDANHKAAADYDRCTIEFLRKEAAAQAAEIERLRAALRWALPLATMALEDCRQQRVTWGHTDIIGTYRNGKTWVGIHQSEVDALEEARAALENRT